MRTCVTHHYACDCREEKFKALLESLKKLMDRFADGTIVRDISKDAQGDYTIRMMEFVMELNNAKAAIAQAEEQS